MYWFLWITLYILFVVTHADRQSLFLLLPTTEDLFSPSGDQSVYPFLPHQWHLENRVHCRWGQTHHAQLHSWGEGWLWKDWLHVGVCVCVCGCEGGKGGRTDNIFTSYMGQTLFLEEHCKYSSYNYLLSLWWCIAQNIWCGTNYRIFQGQAEITKISYYILIRKLIRPITLPTALSFNHSK